MASQFDIFRHDVFQRAIIPKSQHKPTGSIVLELTIKVFLINFHHNCLSDIYSVTNFTLFGRSNFDFDLGVMENKSLLHQTLSAYFNGLGINTGSVHYDNFISEIMERLRMLDRVVNRGDKCMVLPLRSNVLLKGYVQHDYEDAISMSRVLEESEAELERTNYGMVASEGSSVEEMLKNARVEEETKCTVCLEELEVGMNASRMPCSHMFHGYCIKKWLKISHYCPICRYEMPTNDEIKDMKF